MSNRVGGFQKNQTVFGIREIDAGFAFAFDLGGEHLIGAALYDPFVVISGVQCRSRELESTAPFHSAVAGGIIAALPRKDAADVTSESKRALLVDPFDSDVSLRHLAADSC